GDWIELWNVSDNPIDISNWIFMDDSIGAEHTFVLPIGRILAPDERWVMAQDGSLFNETFTDVSNYDASFIFNLSGGGEWIRMYDTTGRLQISVYYNDDAPWPAAADGAGYTLELIDANGVMNDGNNWTTICVGGSPGIAPFAPCVPEDTVAGINATLWEEEVHVYPNQVNNILAVTTSFLKSTTIKVELFNMDGISLREFYNSEIPSGEQTLLCNLENISAGIYMLAITIDEMRYTKTVVKM
ncbi:MAG: lamin tail domain-containing protein, partial [Chitinophagales bacterium]